MQTYRTAQQAIGCIFEKYNTVHFSNAIEEYRNEKLSKTLFMEILDGYSRENEKMRDEINDFFAEKLKRTKTLSRQEVCEVNSELLPGEIDGILRDQTKRSKGAEAEAKKAAKKAEAEAKKAAKKAEAEAKKAAKKAETEAKKAEKRAETEAKKAEKRAEAKVTKTKEPVLESFARDEAILKKTSKRVAKRVLDEIAETLCETDNVCDEPTTPTMPPPEKEETNEFVCDETTTPRMPPPEEQTNEFVCDEPTTPTMPPPEEVVINQVNEKKRKEPKETKPKETKAKKGKKGKEETEEEFIVNGHLLQHTKTNTTYFLRETSVMIDGGIKQEKRVFTKDRMVGLWKETHIEFYNLNEDDVKKMIITPQMWISLEEDGEYYIGTDCTIYNRSSDMLGTYYPKTDTVEDFVECEEELSEDEYA